MILECGGESLSAVEITQNPCCGFAAPKAVRLCLTVESKVLLRLRREFAGRNLGVSDSPRNERRSRE